MRRVDTFNSIDDMKLDTSCTQRGCVDRQLQLQAHFQIHEPIRRAVQAVHTRGGEVVNDIS